MISEAGYLVYPDGDRQQVSHRLRINQLVDLNGNPLQLPLATSRQIVYRVARINTVEDRNESAVHYGLELVTRPELEEEAL